MLNGHPGREQLLPEILHVVPVPLAQFPALLRAEEADGGETPGEDGRGEGGGENEAGAVRADHVDQVGGTGDVAADVAEGLAWGSGE